MFSLLIYIEQLQRRIYVNVKNIKMACSFTRRSDLADERGAVTARKVSCVRPRAIMSTHSALFSAKIRVIISPAEAVIHRLSAAVTYELLCIRIFTHGEGKLLYF